MNEATTAILQSIQDDDLKVQHLITLVDGVLTQLSDLNVTIANLGLSQADADTLLNATKKMGTELDAEIAKIQPGTPVTPPAVSPAHIVLTALPGVTFEVGKDVQFEIETDTPGYVGTVDIITDGDAAHRRLYTFLADEQGRHVDAVLFSTPGTHTITVTDNASGITGSVTVNVVAAAAPPVTPPSTGTATSFAMTVVPAGASLVANQRFSLKVMAIRDDGAIVATYAGKVHLASPDLSDFGADGQDYQFTAGDAGSHLFNRLIPSHSGPITITVSDEAGINGTFTATVG